MNRDDLKFNFSKPEDFERLSNLSEEEYKIWRYEICTQQDWLELLSCKGFQDFIHSEKSAFPDL